VRTNNPPCGAMRGFGAVQVCFAYEAQMDKLAAALGIDPVELRLRNVVERGDTIITGQVLDGATPVEEVVRACASHPLPAAAVSQDPLALPGGAGRTADPSSVRRGVGFALGFKNLMYSEGFDDFSSARCRLSGEVAWITCAAAEVGQGFVTLAQQIAREILGVEDVVLEPADTAVIGSSGSTSASRQTWMSGGAVEAACRQVRDDLLARVATERALDVRDLDLRDCRVVSNDGRVDLALTDALVDDVEAEVVFRHRPTERLDDDGQGESHVAFAYAAHRAVVEVDAELGMIRVVEIATAQDVGRVLNPVQVVGQLEGGISQGLGLAVMEEIVTDDGRSRNPSCTDYLIPTALDMPPIAIAALVEEPEPGAPFGAKGVGELPSISSTAAVAAAIRDATGLELARVPVRPADIALARAAAPDNSREQEMSA
jgi:CO/xanthine dehydrogenase Mo-binding subunit